ncbi:hypothetical protein MSG28_014928 [Choristoneura fumiferana]|uniref:Uncharacterized protein n=4 Tax=Choristoneura fumiferana TaxID=7141 RepID=A0ACC0KYE4_CHOFU|nr:hypothetical protein MSG28_014928 [Choristoneura fumiferana]KAI8441302.1 hypothetical protein MSG28_014928 [Choristoneura fumiferana]
MKILSTLLVGVLLPLATIAANQSGGDSLEIQPMREPAFLEGKRQLETPEVVLQLKYDRGELNRIYLAQFRKNKEAWMPSVPATDSLCSDLCHAGCPPCAALTAESSAIAAHAAVARVLTTAEGWTAWCNAQCRQGQGGAACNCDRAPFQ